MEYGDMEPRLVWNKANQSGNGNGVDPGNEGHSMEEDRSGVDSGHTWTRIWNKKNFYVLSTLDRRPFDEMSMLYF